MSSLRSKAQAAGSMAALLFFAVLARGDVASPPESASAGIDWGYLLMGAVSAFLGALLFLWIGRKISGRSSK